MSFERALLHIFKVEGGFVNRPADHGGPTNFGITIHALASYRKTPVTIDDVRNLTALEAGKIYRQEYWDANALFLLGSTRIQYLLFDQCVARGGHAAVILIQKVLNNQFHAGLKYDGLMGPLTARSINFEDEFQIAVGFIRETQKAYVRQILHDPTQMEFFEGWMNRTFYLFDFLF